MFKPSRHPKHKTLAPTKKAKGLERPLRLQALEPRVLLDAAAAQTAEHLADQAHAQAAPLADDASNAELMHALATTSAQATPAAASSANVYFIDRSLDDVQQLADALPPNAEIHYIESGTDGVQTIAQALQGRSDVASIHILSHGDVGQLQLGSATLSAASMQAQYRDELSAIGQSMTADADILIYGCDFAAGEGGALAANVLSSITGADVAASTDLTGAAALGGDWVLEREVGSVEAAAVSVEPWAGVMANRAPAGTNNTITINEGAVYNFKTADFGFSDVDADALKGVVITTLPPDGKLTYFKVNQRVLVVAGDELTATQAASLRWEPDAERTGNTFFTFQVVDDGGTADGGVDTDQSANRMTISVTAINDAPRLALGEGAQNLVSNGSFESGKAGWSSNASYLDIYDFDLYRVGVADGSFAAEVEGAVMPSTSTATYIEQSITTVSGESYQFSLLAHTRIASNVGDKGTVQIFDATSTTTPIATFSFTAGDAWSLQQFDFKAIGSSTTIRIVSNGSTSGSASLPGDGSGLLLDDVQVRQISASASFTENGTPAEVLPGSVSILDVDDSNMERATVTLASPQTGDRLLVSGSAAASGTLASGISWTRSDSLVTFTGSFTKAQYEAALRLVGFENTSDKPTEGTRSISIVVNDGTVGSNTVTTSVRVVAVNDAPTLTDTNRVLTGIGEDATIAPPSGAVGTQVSTFIGVTADVDTGALKGVAITGVDGTNGTWWFSVDGGTTWQLMGSVSQDNALLLSNAATSRVYFQANADFNGTVNSALTVRAWDQTSGTNGGRGDATINGGTSAFSSASDTVSLAVTAVADIMADTANGANATNEDTAKTFNPITGAGVNAGGADSFEGTPVITAIGGVAIVPGGPAVAVTNGTVTLAADGQTLTFTPAADFNGTATFSYTVTSGGVTETANISIAVTAVADAPRIDLDTTTAGTGYTTTYDQSSVAIGNLVSVSDPEGNNLASMTIKIVGAQAGDLLSGSLPSGLTGSYNAATGTYTITGNATLANYQTALSAISFSTSFGVAGNRTIEVSTVSGTAPTASNVAIATLTVVDTDGDGVANAGDIDDDNDGILDSKYVPGPSYPADTQFIGPTFWDSSSTTFSGGTPYDSTTVGSYLDGSIADAGSYSSIFNATSSTAVLNPPIVIQVRAPQGAPTLVVDRFLIANDDGAAGDGIKKVTVTLYDANGYVLGVEDLEISNPASFSGAIDTYGFSRQYQNISGFSITVKEVHASGPQGAGRFQLREIGLGTSVAITTAVLDPLASDKGRLDLDSDDDGITDNVEAQGSGNYVGPSGQGAAMVDADRDGLDDVYDANTADKTSAASQGLTPVDTDGDATADFIDADSDGDGIADIAERGDGAPTSITSTADSDGDGLLDIFEGANTNDGYDVNDENLSGSTFNLADTDNDVAADGSGAVARVADFDWRDDASAPVANNLPAGWSVNEDATVVLNGLSVIDDVANGTYVVQLTVDSGKLSATGAGGVTVSGSGTSVLTLSGTLADINAFLAGASAPVYTTVPNANGSVNLTMVTKDANGGPTAFSDTDSAVISINPINDAPVLDNSLTLTYTAQEDAPAPSGPVGSLISDFLGGVSDVDAGAVKGIAITGSAPSSGKWWFSTDGGATWTDLGTVSNTSALLLANDGLSRLYFQPTTANFNGTGGATALTFRAWDQTSGTIGTKVTTATNGGTTAFSTAIDTVAVTIAAVNDAPTLTDGARAMTGIGEDATIAPPSGAVGTQVSTFIGVTADVDTGALKGVAITGVDGTNGTWWFSVDGGTTWQLMGSVSQDNALLLSNAATSRVYFQANADFNGTVNSALTVRAWDQTSGTNGGRGDATINGGTSAFSSASDTVSLAVTAVADIMADTANGANATNEDTAKTFNPITGAGVNAGGADSFEGTPVITAIGGVAIVPGGPAVAVTNGTVTLAADGQTLTFTPAADFNGTATFSYTVTSGGVTETANISIAVTAVADAPRIDLDTTTAGTGYATTYDQSSVAIGNLVSVSDPEGNNLTSMMIKIVAAQAGDLLLSGTLPSGLTGSYNAATGIYTITGNATLASYQTALGQIRFSTNAGVGGNRTIEVSAVSGTAPTASNVAIATVAVVDSDGDGVANAADIDDDNDGIVDSVEQAAGSAGVFTGPAYWDSSTLAISNATARSDGPTSNLFDGDTTSATVLIGPGGELINVYDPAIVIEIAAVSPLVVDSFYLAPDIGYVGDGPVRATVELIDSNGNVLVSQEFTNLPNTATGSYTYFFDRVYADVARMRVIVPESFAVSGTTGTLQIRELGLTLSKDTIVDLDNDGDGTFDRLDLDSDNDGITDNVEAQATGSYVGPSGQGAAMVDADRDGLDDVYDANTADKTSVASLGLTPVDTDADGTRDHLDADSDNDGTADIVERGDGAPTSITSTADSDRDGLLDIFEGANATDGFDVNDENLSGTTFKLADTDGDTAADGSNAAPMATDLDYRDNAATPLIDLNSTASGDDTLRDKGVSHTSGGAAVNVAGPGADVTDFGENDINRLAIVVSGVLDGANEIVNIGGVDFSLDADKTATVVIDGVSFDISFTVAAGFVIGRSGGGAMPQAALDSLVRGVTYRNTQLHASNGDRKLSFVVSDATTSSPAAVATISVTGQNTAPAAGNDSFAVTEDQAVSGNVLANDSDADGDTLTLASFTVAGDAAVYAAGDTATIAGVGSLTMAADGSFTFTPAPDYAGAVPTVNYTVSDGYGASASADLTLGPVAQVNDLPVANGESYATTEDTPVNLDLLANDSDVEDGQPTIKSINGVDLTGGAQTIAVTGGEVVIAADGTMQFVPTPNYNGPVTIDYVVTDSTGTTANATATVNVSSINDVPVVVDPAVPGQSLNPGTGNYAITTPEDTAFSGQVAATDADGDSLSYTLGSGPANGTVTVNPDGTYTYTPNGNFNGNDSFVVTIDDGMGGQISTTVNVTIGAVNDLPVANGESYNTTEDTPVNLNLLANDTDVEDGQPTIKSINGVDLTGGAQTIAVTGGEVVIAADGTMQFVPTPNYNGPVTIDYVVTDSTGTTANATATVNVGAINDVPVVVDPAVPGQSLNPGTGNYAITTPEDTAFSGQVAATDADGDSLSYTLGSGPANGTVSVNPDGTYTYTPNGNFNGNDSFVVTIDDGMGGQISTTVNVTIGAVNDLPVANGESYATVEDTPVALDLLANDSDVEDGQPTIKSINGVDLTGGAQTIPVTGGEVVIAADGTMQFVPTPNYNGPVTIDYVVTDSTGTTANATATVNVGAINDVPVVVDPAVPGQSLNPGTGNYAITTPEDTAFSGQVAATDADGDSLGYTLGSGPANGTVTVNPDGTYTYTPNANFNGNDSFVVTIDDGMGGQISTTVNVTIGAVNDLPVANGESYATAEDTPVALDLLANDSDVEDGQPTIESINGVALTGAAQTIPVTGGEVVIAADGTMQFVPEINYNGVVTIDYVVVDGTGATANATATVNVGQINDVPVVVDPGVPGQSYDPSTGDYGITTPEDTPVNGQVAGTDADGDSLSYTLGSGPANGTVSVNPDGTYTYTPNGNFNGNDSFVVTIDDGMGGQISTTVNVTIGAVNDLPVANGESYATVEDTPVSLNLLANDTDVEDGQPTIKSINGVDLTGGAQTIAVTGGEVVIAADGTMQFVPTPNYNGPVTIDYVVTDSTGTTANATATVNVGAINDVPVMVDPAVPGQSLNPGTGNYAITTPEDTAFSGQVAATDADGDSLSYTLGSGPANGTVTVNPDGTYTYTPNGNFNGNDSFVVTIDDGMGGQISTTVNVTIGAVNDLPVANGESYNTTEDTPVNLNLLANDTDVEDGQPTIKSINGVDLTGGAQTIAVTGGEVVIAADGTMQFVPTPNYNGPVAIDYVVTDSTGATANASATVNVGSINDVPVVVDPAVPGQSLNPGTGNYAITTPEDTAFSGQVAATDADGDSLSYTLGSGPANGTVSVNPDGTYTYTPNANFNGNDSFVVTIDDGMGGQISTTVNVTIGAVNDLPVANGESYNTTEDTPVSLNLLANDTDVEDGQPTIKSINGVDLTGGAQTIAVTGGEVVIAADGTMQFVPTSNYNGPVTIDYVVTDSTGTTANATATVNVGAINDVPVVVDPAVPGQSLNPGTGNYAITTPEDTAFSGQVAATDADGDSLSYTLGSGPANGTVSVNPDGTYTYTPNANFNGNDSFVVIIDDGQGGHISTVVDVTVGNVNDAPVAQGESYATAEDTPVALDLLANDSDVEDGQPMIESINGVALTGAAQTIPVPGGQVVIAADGTMQFVPAPNYNGPVTIDYVVVDSTGAMANATATIDVSAVQDAPETVDPGVPGQSYDPSTGDYGITTPEDTPVSGQVSATDADGDSLTYMVGTGAANGTVSVNPDGTYTYTPNADFNGSDSFTVLVDDGKGNVVEAVVNVSVAPVEDAPILVNPGIPGQSFDPSTGETRITTTEDMPVDGQVVATDADGDNLTYTAGTGPNNGTVVVNPDGTYTYTPNPDFSGEDSFTVLVDDGNGNIVEAVVNVSVAPVEDAPILVNPGIPGQSFDPSTGETRITTTEDMPVDGQVVATDADGDNLTYAAGTGPSNGTVVVNPDGTYTYTPNPDFNGEDSFTVLVDDGNGNIVEAVVNVSVAPVEDAPILVNPGIPGQSFDPSTGETRITTTEDMPVDGQVVATDADGDNLTYAAGTGPNNGTVVVNPDGTYTYTPNPDFNGEDSFTVLVDDGNGNIVEAVVNVSVAPVEDAPILVNPGIPGQSFDPSTGETRITTTEDMPVDGQVVATDADGDNLTYAAGTGPSNGTVVVNPDGTYTYTPNPDFNGEDSFTVLVDDGNGNIVEAVVNVSVAPVEDAPILVNPGIPGQSFDPSTGETRITTTEDMPVDGQVVATDADGDNLTYTAGTGPNNGTVVVNPDGTYTYTPNPDFSGEDSFTVLVDDGNGNLVEAVVNVTVDAVNDAPITGNDGPMPTASNEPVSGNVLTNDSDIEGDALTVSQFAVDTDGDGVAEVFVVPPGGNATATMTDASGEAIGQITIGSDGAFTFTPAPGYDGAVPDVVYTAYDGQDASTGTLSFDNVPNLSPEVGGETVVVNEDQPLHVPAEEGLLANDVDSEGDILVIADYTVDGLPGPIVAGEPVQIPGVGTLQINPDGSYSFIAEPEYSGPVPGVSYTVTDGEGGNTEGRLSLEVAAVNDAPIGGNEVVELPANGGTMSKGPGEGLLANDSDTEGGRLTITDISVDGVSGPTEMGKPMEIPGKGTLLVNPDGSYSFTPDPSFKGELVMSYTVSDGQGGTSTGTLTLQVRGEDLYRGDHPFVYVPADAEPAGSNDALRGFDAYDMGGFDSIVEGAVNGVATLNGTPSLDANGVVLSAVNGAQSLSGTQSLGARGVVLSAVNGVDSLRSGESALHRHLGDNPLRDAGEGVERTMHSITSLRADGDLHLELLSFGQRTWLDVSEAGGKGTDITAVRATQADGKALPSWIRVDGHGHIAIDRPVGTDVLQLRITVERRGGAASTQVIEIDFNANEMRQTEGAKVQESKPVKSTSEQKGAALDFGAQLAQATSRPDTTADEELMALLS